MTPHSLVHIRCPHCGTGNQAKMHKREVGRGYYQDIRHGRDPIFDLELYFLDYIRGKQIWAVNREHLNYLIAYVSAFRFTGETWRSDDQNGLPQHTCLY